MCVLESVLPSGIIIQRLAAMRSAHTGTRGSALCRLGANADAFASQRVRAEISRVLCDRSQATGALRRFDARHAKIRYASRIVAASLKGLINE